MLVVRDGRLELGDGCSPKKTIFVDFVKPLLGKRIVAPPRSEPLARAVGLRGEGVAVVDATAGLGGDAFRLATWGCRVTAIERHPVVASLLEDGMRRAMVVPQLAEVVRDRLGLVVADACDYLRGLRKLRDGQLPDVVYLDPMFALESGKASAVRKEMTLLRELLGEDDSSEELLELARSVGVRRVVVKRMRHAAPLGRSPDTTYRGSVVRYDVYLGT